MQIVHFTLFLFCPITVTAQTELLQLCPRVDSGAYIPQAVMQHKSVVLLNLLSSLGPTPQTSKWGRLIYEKNCNQKDRVTMFSATRD